LETPGKAKYVKTSLKIAVIACVLGGAGGRGECGGGGGGGGGGDGRLRWRVGRVARGDAVVGRGPEVLWDAGELVDIRRWHVAWFSQLCLVFFFFCLFMSCVRWIQCIDIRECGLAPVGWLCNLATFSM